MLRLALRLCLIAGSGSGEINMSLRIHSNLVRSLAFLAVSAAFVSAAGVVQAQERSVWDRLFGPQRAASAQQLLGRGWNVVWAGQTKQIVDDRNTPLVGVELLRDGKARVTPYVGGKAQAPVDLTIAADGTFVWAKDAPGVPAFQITGGMAKGRGFMDISCGAATLTVNAVYPNADKTKTATGWEARLNGPIPTAGGEDPCKSVVQHDFVSK
jgi:hypothetical protein